MAMIIDIPKVNAYVCPGDTIKYSHGGYDFVVEIATDSYSQPSDSECYSDEDIRKWKNDQWFYVGIVFTVYKNGIQISDNLSSLWGIEANFGENNNGLDYAIADLAEEAVTLAKKAHKDILAKLSVE